MSKQNVVDENVEQVLEEKYDAKVVEALNRNDVRTVLDLKWGRLFLTQNHGYWVG